MDTDGPSCYPRLLQKYFKDNKDKVEILNFAIDGRFREYKDLQLIKKECITYNPDLVLMKQRFPISDDLRYRESYKGYAINYFDINSSLEETKQFIDENYERLTLFTFFYDVSFIYRYLCKYVIENEKGLAGFIRKYFIKDTKFIIGYARKNISAIGEKKGAFKKEFSIEESLKMYKEVKVLLDKNDTKYILFNTYSNSAIKDVNFLFKIKEIDYLNLNIPFDRSYSFGKYDAHSSQKGHKIIGEKFYEKLIKQRIILSRFLSKQTQDKMLFSKEKNDFQSSISLSQLNLKSFKDDFKLDQLTNYKNKIKPRVLLFWNETSAESFYKYFNEFSEISGNRIELSVIKYDSSILLKDFIRKLDKEVVRFKPNIIISEVPKEMLSKSFTNFLNLSIEYNKHIKDKNGELVFFDSGISNSRNIFEYIMTEHDISLLNLNNVIAKWEVRERGEDWKKKMLAKLSAEILFKTICSDLLPKPSLNPEYNVALNKKVVVSSSLRKHGWHEKNIVNGSVYHIATSRGWVSRDQDTKEKTNKWVLIDLDTFHKINKIILYPRNDEGLEGKGFPKDFTINISKDSIRWKKIVDKKDYPNPKKGEPQIFLFEDELIRYVKIKGTKISEYSVGKNKKDKIDEMSLTEVEVYGIKEKNDNIIEW